MKKKGITIIELLVSISLISVVVLLLLRVMISLNKINNDTTYASSDEFNRTTIIKNIEEDFLKNKLRGLKINKLNNKTEINLNFDNLEEKIVIENNKLTYKDTYLLESAKASYDLCPKINYEELDSDYYLITIKINVLIDKENTSIKDDIVLTYIGLKNVSDNYDLSNSC